MFESAVGNGFYLDMRLIHLIKFISFACEKFEYHMEASNKIQSWKNIFLIKLLSWMIDSDFRNLLFSWLKAQSWMDSKSPISLIKDSKLSDAIELVDLSHCNRKPAIQCTCRIEREQWKNGHRRDANCNLYFIWAQNVPAHKFGISSSSSNAISSPFILRFYFRSCTGVNLALPIHVPSIILLPIISTCIHSKCSSSGICQETSCVCAREVEDESFPSSTPLRIH